VVSNLFVQKTQSHDVILTNFHTASQDVLMVTHSILEQINVLFQEVDEYQSLRIVQKFSQITRHPQVAIIPSIQMVADLFYQCRPVVT
jgi:hypothetical protein